MNIIDKIILKLYLWRFPEKPFEQKPTEPIPNVQSSRVEIRTINGVCWVPERPFLHKWITEDDVARKIVAAMTPDLAKCINVITTEKQDDYNMLHVQGSIDVVISGNDIKFGD